MMTELVGARVTLQSLGVGGIKADPEGIVLTEIEAEEIAERARIQPDPKLLDNSENINWARKVRVETGM